MTNNFKKHKCSNGNSYTFTNVPHHFYNFKKRVILHLLITKLKIPLMCPIFIWLFHPIESGFFPYCCYSHMASLLGFELATFGENVIYQLLYYITLQFSFYFVSLGAVFWILLWDVISQDNSVLFQVILPL